MARFYSEPWLAYHLKNLCALGATTGDCEKGTHLVIAQDMAEMDPMAFQSIGLNTLVNGANDGAADNSLRYRSAEFYGLSAAYMHQLGGSRGSETRQRRWSDPGLPARQCQAARPVPDPHR